MTVEDFLTAHNLILSLIGGLFTYFMYRIDRKFDKMEAKFDVMQGDIKSINTRLARLEGAYFGKDLPKHIDIQEG